MKRERIHSMDRSNLRFGKGGVMRPMAGVALGLLSGVVVPMLAWGRGGP